MKKKHFIILLIAAFVALTAFAIYSDAFDIGFKDAQKNKTIK
jgi:hypothetical protein